MVNEPRGGKASRTFDTVIDVVAAIAPATGFVVRAGFDRTWCPCSSAALTGGLHRPGVLSGADCVGRGVFRG